jgi:serine/threonine protein kinase
MVPTINGRHAPVALPEYAILFQQIPFPPYLSSDTVDIISRLLDVNDLTRLGAGPRGLQNIKSHPYFQSIDWELLEQKHLEPPYIPKTKPLEEVPQYPNFDTMMRELGKTSWLTDLPKPEDDRYFSSWYILIWHSVCSFTHSLNITGISHHHTPCVLKLVLQMKWNNLIEISKSVKCLVTTERLQDQLKLAC